MRTCREHLDALRGDAARVPKTLLRSEGSQLSTEVLRSEGSELSLYARFHAGLLFVSASMLQDTKFDLKKKVQ